MLTCALLDSNGCGLDNAGVSLAVVSLQGVAGVLGRGGADVAGVDADPLLQLLVCLSVLSNDLNKGIRDYPGETNS